MSVSIKSAEDVAGMRVAGRIASEVLDYITPHVRPGVTTKEIDQLCNDFIVNVQKVIPANVGYAPPGHTPFPGTVCTSVNHVVCHGIPGDKMLKEGDAVNIDVAVIVNGYFGDTSRMYFAGKPTIQARRLSDITYECMWEGIRVVRPGAHLGDIGAAIQKKAEANGCTVVREFCGHGIGRRYHEEPQVLHYGKKGTGLKLQPGMMFTIEPMINAGKAGIRILADGWTVVTADHSLSAQWEHTLLVTPDGYEVTTVSVGTPPPPPLSSGPAPVAQAAPNTSSPASPTAN